MQERILWTIAAFVGTIVIVYFVLSGGMNVYGSRKVAYVLEEKEIVADRSFGLSDVWMKKYHVIVRNEIDLLLDADQDSLTLAEEYKHDTNPYESDTDGDGYNDGAEVKNGYAPNGSGMIDTNENFIPDKWEIDMIGHVIVGGNDDPDGDMLSHYDEYIFGTHPLMSDTDGDGYNDGRELAGGYDPVAPGDARIMFTMTIDKIDVEVPIILSKNSDEVSLQKDLEKGVIHYPGTALPGQRGNAYIAGHSSNYVWSRGVYNYVFKDLNDVIVGDAIIVTMTLANGKKISFDYFVTLKEEVAPDDGRIFAQSQSQELTVTTCWPLGTNARRLMIKAQLQEV